MTANQLKKKLQQIKNNDWDQNPLVQHHLLESMLTHIGSVDPELRDDLICSAFYIFIPKDELSNTQHREVLTRVLDDNHLFYKLGEIGTSSVFTRTFSALVVQLILSRHIATPFLREDEISHVYRTVMDYLINEKDLRGFVKEKGWAHSIAHAADVLNALSCCPELTSHDLLTILEAIQSKMSLHHYVYVNMEDERLVTAIHTIIKRDLVSTDDLLAWLDGFRQYPKKGIQPDDYNILTNIKNLLRSLYFRLLNTSDSPILVNHILTILNDLNTYN